MNNFKCEHLIAMGRQVPTPFYLSLVKDQQKEEEIKIDSILRIVPGRRLIGLSNWRNQAVIVKLFFGPGHWKRNLLSDIRGIHLLRQRHIPTPDILHQTTTLDGNGAALLIDYLEQGKSLLRLLDEASSEERKLSIIKMAVATIAKCHTEGLWQNDIHLDNFMLLGERIYLLDGGEIGAIDTHLDLPRALDNLSLFFAQFAVDMDKHISGMLDHYQSHGSTLPDSEIETFHSRVISKRQHRLDNFEKKLFRSTTANHSIQDSNRFVVYDREIHSNDLESFIENPSSFIKDENMLKAGNASTVASVALDNRRFVLKRYNLKSLWHSLKYLFKPSRAHRSWLNASLLEMLGVNSPHPYLIHEERAFWIFRRRAYFLSEDLDASNLLEQFDKAGASALPVEKLVIAFKQLFETMITYQISHGDMKASNFVYLRDRLYVLDLDAMKRHKNRGTFNRAIKKDINRFMKNWQGSSIESDFEKMVEGLEFST
ncbi:MAG: hypothetical protein GKR91_15950 [Pseudomonadales bacterium]|nr:hypothetical protein [Pseudomonadales bacterium]